MLFNLCNSLSCLGFLLEFFLAFSFIHCSVLRAIKLLLFLTKKKEKEKYFTYKFYVSLILYTIIKIDCTQLQELRKDGFDLAEARFRELKPILDEVILHFNMNSIMVLKPCIDISHKKTGIIKNGSCLYMFSSCIAVGCTRSRAES